MTTELDGGITQHGQGYEQVEWNILGQRYFPKADCESTFAFEANSEAGQFVPVHIHPTQDEFIFLLEGQLELKLDGKWMTARPGDLVRMPRGIPHGYFNKSDKPARALFWVSPAGRLRDLFKTLHNMSDVEAVIRASAEHDVDFLPQDAND
ncbi:cupin domain-containing protein [Labrys sp. KNU-23]|uniref:cupin domain-containing protein n=1 Tax=Labrys sp. KNU-23 TaxID=2789216 RepID=UPI0011F084BD|nr:cupin domain-containing protein [Labrys sp. KNU-23]QEN85157.1 cupin domain-containing protein [Labrys sp. KNU-23]